MICEYCQGKGRQSEALTLTIEPCLFCGGFGIVHCCEGEQVHSRAMAQGPLTRPSPLRATTTGPETPATAPRRAGGPMPNTR